MNLRPHHPPHPGLFVTLEGTEGCGKSTQTARLVARLRALGLRTHDLREPGATPLGEEIRHTLKHSPAGHGMVPEAELLLFNAARAQLVREIIRPALAAGDCVVCDRFLHSTLAYQGWGRGLDRHHVESVLEIAVGTTRPDLTLLLRVPPDTAAARRLARSQHLPPTASHPATPDRLEAESDAFFARVDAGFATLATEDPDHIVTLDAEGSIDAVEARIWRHVEPRLPTPTTVTRSPRAQENMK